jgi:hypothetical protein
MLKISPTHPFSCAATGTMLARTQAPQSARKCTGCRVAMTAASPGLRPDSSNPEAYLEGEKKKGIGK